jgi:hypothetical protein
MICRASLHKGVENHFPFLLHKLGEGLMERKNEHILPIGIDPMDF